MIGQTVAIFVDAYRDLNSRKLFWITLILSAVFVAAFALLGVDVNGLKIATAHIDMPLPQAQYMFKMVFRLVIIGIWLTWAATILALVSTSGIFPDLITGGSIDLYLSKPLSRGRLFATKYVAGLIFVSLQVIVVAVGGYLIMGWRGHEWLPQLFWAIPIVICFFSYLFAICVFFGVLTRSTIAALLLTIGAWGVLAALDYAEPVVLSAHDSQVREADRLDADARDEALFKSDDASPPPGPTTAERAQSERDWAMRTDIAHRILYGIKTITPKTADTIDLLNRYVFTDEEVERSIRPPRRLATTRADDDRVAEQQSRIESGQDTARELRGRSVSWVVGTSLLFEGVLVTWAGWIFCRRDY